MNSPYPKILVAPLDWGLGHATRCIPVVRELLKQQCEVLISAAGNGEVILQGEFPSLKFIDIPGIQIKYPANGSMVKAMMNQVPAILKAISIEHKILQEIIDEYKITHVISDNRYGLYSSKAKTAFITHQVNIKSDASLKFLEPVLKMMNKNYIEKFNELWIPDFPPPNHLSGDLSDASSIKIPVKHLGCLTRFNEKATAKEKKYDVIALLSGPEPQRTLLEEKLIPYLLSTNKKCLLIQGLPATDKKYTNENLEVIASIASEKFSSILHPDTLLIARPGYSTIMDLSVLGHQRILFIPTPGQTEQEYLAKRMNTIYGVAVAKQLQVFPDADEIMDSKFIIKTNHDSLLKDIIKGWIY